MKITSKNTSVNTKRLPAIYNKINWGELQQIFPRLKVYDIGCGRETGHIQKFLAEKNIEYMGYDPYWLPDVHLYQLYQEIITSQEEKGIKPVIICSNVLNVIPDYTEMMRLKEWITDLQEIYFISVYEGDKTGIGRESKKDCWQWNLPAKHYRTGFFEMTKGNIITLSLYAKYI